MLKFYSWLNMSCEGDDVATKTAITVEGISQRWVQGAKILGVLVSVCVPLHLGLLGWLVAQTYGTSHRVGMNEYKIELSSADRYTKIQADLDNAEQTAFLLDQIRQTNKETLAAIQKLAEDLRDLDRRALGVDVRDINAH